MKKLLSILLLVGVMLTLFSCSSEGDGYAPVEQTEEESQTVVSMTFGEDRFDVPFDIYRALFLNMKSTVDGGDDSVWSSKDKEIYIEKINGYVFDMLAEIYSAFALCKKLGYDMYSDSVNAAISDYVANMVDGVYSGDYDGYLADLKAANLNYSAQELMIRYTFAEEVLEERYISMVNTSDSDNLYFGSEKYSKNDVLAFYNSSKASRVLYTSISAFLTNAESRAEELADDLSAASELGVDAVKDFFGQNSSLTIPEIKNGIVITQNTLSSDSAILAEAAEKMPVGSSSDIIVGTGTSCVYYVMYKMEKSSEHFSEKYTEIATIFLKDKLGEKRNSAKAELLETLTQSDFLKNLNYSEIKV